MWHFVIAKTFWGTEIHYNIEIATCVPLRYKWTVPHLLYRYLSVTSHINCCMLPDKHCQSHSIYLACLGERMLNCSASLVMSTSILEALPGKLDIKRHSPSSLYVWENKSQYKGLKQCIV